VRFAAQSAQCVLIERKAPALPDDRPIPVQLESLQSAQDLLGATRNNTLSVQILDPDQPAAAMPARIEEAADCSDERSEMQGAGGRRSESADI
jgi:hypothetical protein